MGKAGMSDMKYSIESENKYPAEMIVRSNEDLYEVITHEDNYVPEALQAARNEITARKLSPEIIANLEAKMHQKTEENKTLSNPPLQWSLRIIMFLLSFGAIQAVVGEYYRNKGCERKYRECWLWMKYGLIFWVSLTVIHFILKVK